MNNNTIDRDNLTNAAILLDAVRTCVDSLFEDFFDAFDPETDDSRQIAYAFKRAKSQAHAVLYLLHDISDDFRENEISFS